MNGDDVLQIIRTKLIYLLVCFLAVSVMSYFVLHQLSPSNFVSTGVLELGYFNPRDYNPHPVRSTRGISAWVADGSFQSQVRECLNERPGETEEDFSIRPAPLEEGVIKIEARSADPELARQASAVACSLIIERTNEPFEREYKLLTGQVALLRERASLAESLITNSNNTTGYGELAGGAIQALSHLTELLIEAETETELLTQKKQTVLLVHPGTGVPDRPALMPISVVIGGLVTLFLAAIFISSGTGRKPE